MIERGLVDEVKDLLERGYSPELPAMSGLGYKQIVAYIKGETSLEETVQRIKFETHRFARSQYAWFRPKDEHIHWFDIGDKSLSSILSLISQFASDNGNNLT
jgi:tRNA dimethylallyltransferase